MEQSHKIVCTPNGSIYSSNLKKESNSTSLFRTHQTKEPFLNVKRPNSPLHKGHNNYHITHSSNDTSWYIRDLANENYSKAKGFLYNHKKSDRLGSNPIVTSSNPIKKNNTNLQEINPIFKDSINPVSTENHSLLFNFVTSPTNHHQNKKGSINGFFKSKVENIEKVENEDTPTFLKLNLNKSDKNKMNNCAITK